MNKKMYILNILRRLYKKIYTPKVHPILEYIHNDADIQGQAVSDLIKAKLKENKPLMISRLGTELFALLNYKEVNCLNKDLKYIKGQLNNYNWNEIILERLYTQTGFFPPTIPMAEKFSEYILEDIKLIDIWGQWQSIEKYFEDELKHTTKIKLFDIDPFIHKNPWSSILRKKKVLVVHPFEKTIIAQYRKRELLFSNPSILPEFELKTIKAVQSSVNSQTEYKDWFEALENMKNKITAQDFDIALIGCGSYGLPLAAHVKRLGKQAIHIGGSLQLLFGIIGTRWENHPEYSHYINENWVRPSIDEVPENYLNLENGAYW